MESMDSISLLDALAEEESGIPLNNNNAHRGAQVLRDLEKKCFFLLVFFLFGKRTCRTDIQTWEFGFYILVDIKFSRLQHTCDYTFWQWHGSAWQLAKLLAQRCQSLWLPRQNRGLC